MDEKDSKQAIDAYRSRLNSDANDLEAALALGNLFFDIGESAQAIVYYNIALGINPDQPGAKTDLGTVYWRNGDVSMAERCFTEVVEKYPGFGNAYINLGLLLVNARMEPKKGKAYWQELVENFPEHPAAAKARSLLTDSSQ